MKNYHQDVNNYGIMNTTMISRISRWGTHTSVLGLSELLSGYVDVGVTIPTLYLDVGWAERGNKSQINALVT